MVFFPLKSPNGKQRREKKGKLLSGKCKGEGAFNFATDAVESKRKDPKLFYEGSAKFLRRIYEDS